MRKAVDRALARQVAALVPPLPNCCWLNAARAIKHYPFQQLVWYIEGWLVTGQSRLVIEHSWLETPDRIVDVTLLWDEALAQGRYYSGLRFSRAALAQALGAAWDSWQLAARVDQARAAADRGEILPLVWRYDWRGAGCPEYVVAWQKALARAKALRRQDKLCPC